MRKIIFIMIISIVLFGGSISLVSCKAITAQNIDINPSPGIDFNSGMNVGPGVNRGNKKNRVPRIEGDIWKNADFVMK